MNAEPTILITADTVCFFFSKIIDDWLYKPFLVYQAFYHQVPFMDQGHVVF